MNRMPAGDFAHLAQQVLQNGRLPALRAVQCDSWYERDGRRQGAGRLAVLLQQFGAVWTVEALLHLLSVDVVFASALENRKIISSVGYPNKWLSKYNYTNANLQY